MDSFDWLFSLYRSGESPFFRELQSPLEAESVVDGRKVIMLGANNYLGLTTHPKVMAAAKAAIDRYGTGFTGSRLMNGTSSLHIELEERLAAFFGAERALVFSAGYLANIGTLSGLGRMGSYLISDRRNHASILDGQRTAASRVVRFDHNDVWSLRAQLETLPKGAPKWVVVEGVYSTHGNLAALPELVSAARDVSAQVILDDAHGVGVMGFGGRGTARHFGLDREIAVVVGTFSKSLASYGGFAFGDRDVIEEIGANARSFIFTASLPPASVATVLAALEVIDTEPEWLERLWANKRRMETRLRSAGLLSRASDTPIIPIHIGSEAQTWAAWRALFERGVYANAMFPPSVPPGQSLLRLSMMATFEDHQIDLAADALVEAVSAAGRVREGESVADRRRTASLRLL